MRKPKVIDAKFEVISEPTSRPRYRRAGWFDWRNFLIVGGLSSLAAIKALLDGSQ